MSKVSSGNYKRTTLLKSPHVVHECTIYILEGKYAVNIYLNVILLVSSPRF